MEQPPRRVARARRSWDEFDRRWTSYGEDLEPPPRGPRPRPPASDPEWRAAWLPRAIVSGLVATFAMSLTVVPAYFLALSIGSADPAAPTLQRWFQGLAENALTERTTTALPAAVTVHVLVGIAWAVVYAALVEPRLAGPAWRKGLLFCLAPWALSLVVLFPLVGGGWFGTELGAGPLPIVGNLVAHLVYGAVLGVAYSPASDLFRTDWNQPRNPEELRMLHGIERAVALESIAGLGFGAVVGWLAGAALGGEPSLAALFGAVIGTVTGATIGSFRGMNV